MKRGGRWLSQRIEPLAFAHEQGTTPQFDVVVVGSGYGGAVAAARLAALAQAPAERPMQVCVLERGLEYPPGSFPDRFVDAVGHQRVSGAAAAAGQSMPEGLMDWRLGDGDVWALVANGLGGGSLINAGVCEPADGEVLARKAWPEPWRGNTGRWTELYARASRALGASPWNGRGAPRQSAMAELATTLQSSCRPVALSIVPAEIGNASPAAGDLPADDRLPERRRCIGCGDCFTGCNVGAKLTLTHTYLGQAYRCGAALYCGATVRRVVPIAQAAPGQARWSVHYVLTDRNRLPGRTEEFEIRARHVVLAAGTFGSTEILMRARSPDFHVSGRLGEGFSANGDLLSAYYGYRETSVRPVADENQALRARGCGPTITSQITWQEPVTGVRRVVQDLGVPGALGWMFSEVLTTMMVPQRWTRWHLAGERPGDHDTYAVNKAEVERSLLTVSYVDDGAAGRLEPSPAWGGTLRDGALVVRWKDIDKLADFKAAHERLEAARPSQAYLLRNPLWQFMPKDQYLGIGQATKRLLTVHPLGGCRMADSAHDGVVDPWGRVYDAGLDFADRGDPAVERLRRRHEGRAANALHEGLYVLDGSIVPTALGINPLLTITALAEGAIDEWAVDEGWHRVDPPVRKLPPLVLPPAPTATPSPSPPATSVRFGERMTARMAPEFQPPEGGPGRPRLSVQLDFDEVPDLRAFLAHPQRSTGLQATFAIGLEGAVAPAGARGQNDLPVSSARMRGQVWWFEVEPSCFGQRLWRSFITWARSRAGADAVESRHRQRSMFEGALDKVRGGSHFGAVRRLRYELELDKDWALGVQCAGREITLPAGTVLRGAKRVGYLRIERGNPESANPWLQLSDLPLVAHPKGGTPIELGVLRFDEMAMLDRHQLPIEVTGQADALSAMRDLASLALYFGRSLFGLHMLSFRRPEYPAEIRGPRGLQRLPPSVYPPDDTRFADLEISVHAVPVALHAILRRQGDATPGASLDTASNDAAPVQPATRPEVIRLRLTRLRRSPTQAPADAAGADPVLLIHGFGSGGIQFTHPAIVEPMAPWLARQGFDVWVAELRTSIGLPTARRQWLMDDIAQEDIPALVESVCAETGREQVQVVAHCIGAAMFSMAVLAGKLARPGGGSRIARAVLMQVGPEVELPRGSRARGYVAHRLQQVFGLAEVHSVASQDPDDAESMLDRLLNTLLYPEEDGPGMPKDAQRRHYRLQPAGLRGALSVWLRRLDAPGRKQALAVNTRRVNANRSAGIFGQLFQYENLNSELLDVLEDVLGGCNLTTYEQTAQYAFGHRVTDQRGDDAYTTTAHLQKHFRFPTLLLHGANNRTFAPRTLRRNAILLGRAGTPVLAVPVPGHGHLDCVVGQYLASTLLKVSTTTGPLSTSMFGLIDCHLKGQLPPAAPPTAAPPSVRLPSMGPWIGHSARAADGTLTLRLGLRLHELGNALKGVASVLVDARGTAPGSCKKTEPVVQTMHEQVIEASLPAADCEAGRDIELLVGEAHGEWPAGEDALLAAVLAKEDELKADAERLGHPPRGIRGLRLDGGWLARQVERDPRDLGLVLGACRQRPLLVDRQLADASLGHALEHLGPWSTTSGAEHALVDAVLLCGDQVYADSRADTTHPGATGGRFFDAYREAWTAPNQRELMRRRPVYFALDDHEFRNDYNDVIARGRPEEYAFARRAWWRYQMAAGPRGAAAQPGPAWTDLELRGFRLFICDTRSERRDPPTVDRSHARIMGHRQMGALCSWLLACHRDPAYAGRPKIVMMGSAIAPQYAAAHEGPGSELASDGWERFPVSLAELFGCIAEHGIDRVLFLSGDYHHHADLALRLQAPRKPVVEARSIVTSGLYCPYPFANAVAEEWFLPADFGLQAGGVRWDYRVTGQQAGSGYTRLTLRTGASPQVNFVPV